MIEPNASSVSERFEQVASAHPQRPFLRVLPETARAYQVKAGEITYAEMSERVARNRDAYVAAGYGTGHRVGLLVANRPAFFEHWFALNSIGVSVVPVNPDLRRDDLHYLLSHSEQVACVVAGDSSVLLQDTIRSFGLKIRVIPADGEICSLGMRAESGTIDAATESALLYTSGTTGLPKGCVLSNAYFLNCGDWYANVGGYCTLRDDGERMLTPLPLFHMNAMACSVMAMISVAGCLIVLDRFHAGSWWQSVREARATIVHYLGVMPSILMQAAALPADRDTEVRFGFGAGVVPSLHAAFEERFGFPLIEAWAMTETGNGAVVAASHEPRYVGESCFGRPAPAVECRIEPLQQSAGGRVVGELLVRRAGSDPRYGFFDRYLKDEQATREAWRGGWFRTGDIVSQDDDGSMRFVDRRKNVIRRSGENIAAVEVESTLLQHGAVDSVAVAAVADPIRGDEVLACIKLKPGVDDSSDPEAFARELVEWCLQRLAYFKAPGYVALVESLPLTATNKIQRGAMRALTEELMSTGRVLDCRQQKKRPVS